MIIACLACLVTFARASDGYVYPVCQETGRALDAFISSLRSVIPNCIELLKSRPKPLPEPSYWQKLEKLVGFRKELAEESTLEPGICNNGVVVLSLLIMLCLYILFIKKYFVTVKNPRAEFIPFMAGEDDTYDTEIPYEQMIRPRPTRSCTRCGCLSYDRGDI